MKLTDQEQVVVKVIGHGVAEISRVIKAVGYPKATTKKILARLNEKGIVALHRHDYPQSLKPEQRKLMLRLKDGQGHWAYYYAVSMRKRNPKGKHLRGATAKQERQYEHILESAKKYHRYGKRKKEVAARTVKARAKNKSGRGREALKTTGRALKKAASSVLGAGSQILGAGAKALNPHRRIRVRNKYIDLVIKGQAKKTPQGWKVGQKTFAQGRGTVSVSSGYYLDRHTGMVYAKRERNPIFRAVKVHTKFKVKKSEKSVSPALRGKMLTKVDEAYAKDSNGDKWNIPWFADVETANPTHKRHNVEQGFYDASGFHPIRASSDYSEGQRPSRSKKAKATKRKAKVTASHRHKVTSRKKTTKSLVGRSLRRTTSTGKRLKRHNIIEGFYDASGVFHPIRSSADYSPAAAGETGHKTKRTRSHKKLAAKRKASATARHRSVVKTRKGTTRRLAGRAIKKSSGLLKKRGRKNPSAESIRKTFAGSVSGSRDLYFPQGTPQRLAKLGKLVSITTEKGTIKPVNGSAWLCADTKEKLHIGSMSPNPLFDGPKRNFGKVSKVEYESSKPHLGYKGPIIWFHHMGEESGRRPTLHADGKGGLVFKGGQYRLTKRGIEN